jgi:hypothetical protein
MSTDHSVVDSCVNQNEDHLYGAVSYHSIQPRKKVECLAKIVVHEIVQFPQFVVCWLLI